MLKFGKKKKEPKKPYGITEEFISNMNSYSTEEKKAALIRLQKEQSETETFLKTNPTIVEKKEELKTLKAPCNETLKSVKNRITYILDQLTEQGTVL